MSSRTKARPQPNEPHYVGWRAELIAKLALTRAGLIVQDAPAPQPFDLLVSTPDGIYFLVEAAGYSSMHSSRGLSLGRSSAPLRWPVDASVLRAAAQVNLPAVLFVIDADREVGHYARLDRLPPPDSNQRTTSVALTADRDLTPAAIAALVSELRHDRSASRRPA
jgi:hypothetical protein